MQNNNWSNRITNIGNALKLEKGVFTFTDPKRIAISLSKSAKLRKSNKVSEFRSAMSMLVFYINRGGKKLSPNTIKILEQAKNELRLIYGKNIK